MTLQKTFRIKRGLTARSCGGNRLAIGEINEISAGKYTFEVGAGGATFYLNISLFLS